MVAILEKTEHNTDFNRIVDFLEASHIRYALTVHPTVYVSHIRQFWSTTRVKTTDGETKILAKVNGRQWTVSKSSIRRHLKLNDEEDETAFLTGDVRYGEAFPTITRLDSGQDKEKFAKTSAMPHEASPRVTSLGGGEDNLEITQLKTIVKTLKDKEKRREGLAQEDAPNAGGGMDQREDLLVGDTVKDSDKSADKESESTDEMANVLDTLGAANILASRGLWLVFTTASLLVAIARTIVSSAVATTSESFPTAVVFTTASVATLTIRVTRSSRGPSKEKVLEEMSVQLARDLEAKFAQKDQIIKEQAERDYEIDRIHAKRDLNMIIAELDRSNKIVAKYLSEYKQAEAGSSHDEKVVLINELLMYQRHLPQIKKYQAQQNKPATKTERRDLYMSILRSNAVWKVKDFNGMTFKQIEEKFIPVWEKMQDFVPMNSKLESERLKRPEIQLGKEIFKK
nr:hypothetical protein [Tanacetum cinerariifolium]